MSQQSNPRKVGRPKLPKGEAKGKIVPVHFALEDLKATTARAKASKQNGLRMDSEYDSCQYGAVSEANYDTTRALGVG